MLVDRFHSDDDVEEIYIFNVCNFETIICMSNALVVGSSPIRYRVLLDRPGSPRPKI